MTSLNNGGGRLLQVARAEVLITLGIIGIVAAMTIPTLIQAGNNKDVEIKLKKFYVNINEALKFSEAENGSSSLWFSDTSGAILDPDGNPIEGSSKQRVWFEKYFGPYLKIQKVTVDSTNTPIFYFMDGTALSFPSHTTRDWLFYTMEPEKCLNKHGSLDAAAGRCVFYFNFMPLADPDAVNWQGVTGKGIIPYLYSSNNDEDRMKGNCKSGGNGVFCTALIFRNGWKIPDDYPREVD